MLTADESVKTELIRMPITPIGNEETPRTTEGADTTIGKKCFFGPKLFSLLSSGLLAVT